jgi:hypothetical protein
MPIIRETLQDTYKFIKQLYLLALAVKTKNHITMGLIALCLKLGKQFEELQARMIKDQESY